MTSTDQKGAGAWVRPKFYSIRTLTPGKLSYASDAEDEQRIRWAGGAITRELVEQGYLESTTGLGVFGRKVDDAIKHYQEDWELVADGVAGQKTLRLLCWPYLIEMQARLKIPNNLLYGMIGLESGFDPGAQGVIREHGTDMGLAQINDEAHTVSPALAYGNIRFAIGFAGSNLVGARPDKDSPTYAELNKWDCAVLSHNSPVRARLLFRDGVYPTVQSAEYVWYVATVANQAPKT